MLIKDRHPRDGGSERFFPDDMVASPMNMFSTYIAMLLGVLISYVAYRSGTVRTLAPSPMIGGGYCALRPEFTPLFLAAYLLSIGVGELAFRGRLMYGMKVYHLQLLVSVIVTFVYSSITEDPTAFVVSPVAGLMGYETFSSNKPITSLLGSLGLFSLSVVVCKVFI